jgi:hypothetical protein
MQVYSGTVVHSKSIDKLEILQHAVVGVEKGKIAFLETLSATKPLDKNEINLAVKELASKYGFVAGEVRIVY